MKKIYLIEKIEAGNSKFLFKVYSACYWTDDINQATQFETEKKADDCLQEDVREKKKSFFKITSFFTNK